MSFKFTRLQIAVHIGSLIPLVWLIVSYFTGRLTFNPIQAATQRTGQYAIILLILSLACTPATTVLGFSRVLTLRRPLGLYAFAYALIHFTIFVAWDYGFSWALILQTIVEKRFVIVGLTAFAILLPLALTSCQWWMIRLGRAWKTLHRLVYLAALLAVLHYGWAVKGDIFSLRGDVWKPLVYGAVVILLLLLRLPAVRKWVVNTRERGLARQ